MLKELERRLSGKRVVIVGVGNPLRADDAAGPALIERMQGKVAATLIDVGDVPENYLGPVEAAQPQVVLIIDAADLGANPGDTALIEIERLAQTGLTTHHASLTLFAQLLRASIPVGQDTNTANSDMLDILLLAIQPMNTAFGAPISPVVEQTLSKLEALLLQTIGKPSGSKAL